MMSVKLKIIPTPVEGTRSCVLTYPEGPALMGKVETAPFYFCGSCGAVLIEGVDSRQFVDGSRPSQTFRGPSIKIPCGVMQLTGTTVIHDERVTIVSEGPLVLVCGRCLAANEMAELQ
jgi:hypothetical protein